MIYRYHFALHIPYKIYKLQETLRFSNLIIKENVWKKKFWILEILWWFCMVCKKEQNLMIIVVVFEK